MDEILVEGSGFNARTLSRLGSRVWGLVCGVGFRGVGARCPLTRYKEV